jgi:F420-non-reducing hydrogenase large subunit
MKKITISPISRIEGHASVTVNLDDKGEVADAHFHATELRGFEKFLEGAAVEEAPRITPRICGICPTVHHLASAKAVDAIFGVQIPETALKLRKLLDMGQFIGSHSLHLFYLAMPDFILGPDSNPALRNVAGLVKANETLAKQAVEARKIGQRITEEIGGKPIHPISAIPGGMSFVLSEEKRAQLEGYAKRSVEISKASWPIVMEQFEKNQDIVNGLGLMQSDFLGMTSSGKWETYDGNLRALDGSAAQICDFPGSDYLNYIEEMAETYSYMKFTKLKKGNGFYRVGPLARVNVVDSMGTPEADKMLAEFRTKFGRAPQASMMYHLARVIEYMAASETALALLQDPAITGKNVRSEVTGVKSTHGVGVVEATRGVLIHDYTVNEKGFITKANLIVATGHNNRAIDKGVLQASQKLIHGDNVSEGLLNRIEMVVRAYDPCVSCATHAIGKMPLVLRVIDSKGEIVREVERC